MLYEQILSHETPLVGSTGGKPEREVQVGHSIFLNNLQAGKVTEFITNGIVRNSDRKEKLAQKGRIYCNSAPRKSMSFIIVIHSHEKLKAFFFIEVESICRNADRSIVIFRAGSWGNIYGFNKFVRTNDRSVKPLTLGKCTVSVTFIISQWIEKYRW